MSSIKRIIERRSVDPLGEELIRTFRQVQLGKTRREALRDMADRSGQAAVVEPTVEGIEVRYPQDGLLVMTNHAVCPAWAGKESEVPPDSHPRYNRLHELLGEGVIDDEAVKQALRDHEGLVCSHRVIDGRKLGTLWSVVGHPGERQLDIAAGSPCQTEYQTVSF